MGKILIIDDNRDAADMLAAILMLHGYEVRTAYDGTQGLDTVGEFVPDIVFLDLGMPGRNGYEIAEEMRCARNLKQPYLIAFTAWNDRASVARTERVGFDRHLTKTCSIDEVLGAVQRGAQHQTAGRA